MPSETEDFHALKKAELHAHLNGCIPPSTVRHLLKKLEVEVPHGFDLDSDLVVRTPKASLAEYLKPWLVLKRLPIGKECLRSMASDALKSLASDNVVYAELRNSPYNIATLNSITLSESLEWLVECLDASSVQHGIDARLVVSFTRDGFELQRASDLLEAVASTGPSPRIVGIDMSGNEDIPIPSEASAVFRKARDDLGLGISIHAGETGSVQNILWAVENCGAQRISHGLAAAMNRHALETLRSRDVCVEVCLRTSVLTGGVASLDDHPIHRFLQEGIPFVLCSDNPQTNGSSLSQEYAYFHAMTSREDVIHDMYQRQRRYSFEHCR